MITNFTEFKSLIDQASLAEEQGDLDRAKDLYRDAGEVDLGSLQMSDSDDLLTYLLRVAIFYNKISVAPVGSESFVKAITALQPVARSIEKATKKIGKKLGDAGEVIGKIAGSAIGGLAVGAAFGPIGAAIGAAVGAVVAGLPYVTKSGD